MIRAQGETRTIAYADIERAGQRVQEARDRNRDILPAQREKRAQERQEQAESARRARRGCGLPDPLWFCPTADFEDR